MPQFSLSRSTVIDAPIEKVYTTVRDFKQWPIWSPWLIVEPRCKVSYTENGKSYSWEGDIVGSGEMEITSEEPNRKINYRLTFLKPWKSVASVSFGFQDKGGSTEATWSMNSSLPFFMFWMKNTMVALIGMDYQRGLSMLKDHIETSTVPSKLEFPGASRFEGGSYIGIRTSCPIADIGIQMEKDFKTLGTAIETSNITRSGKPFTIYHKYDLVKGITEYTSALPVESTPENTPSGLFVAHMDSGDTYQVKHIGPYRHLGNPWSAGMMYGRAKVFKQDKKRDPFETYDNDPQEVPENELITTVHFPVA